MCNHHLRNTELFLKAKGHAHICKDGVDSIITALKELERHGYITRQHLRYVNGQLGDMSI